MKKVVIHSDGGCHGNPGPGGWAATLSYGSHRKDLSGGEPATTNNRMELQAAIEALTALKEPCEVEFFTDSEYVKNGITAWLATWKTNGWRTKSKKAVKNEDLWRALDSAAAKHQVKWNWLKGHAGHDGNERCDLLANEAIAKVKSSQSAGQLKAALNHLVSKPDGRPTDGKAKLEFDSALPQGTLDIDEKKRSNGFAWRGQFSPQLVESLISAYCPERAHILDPFSGSGTSLLEAASLGRPATAIEINPAGWLLTRVYTLCNLRSEQIEAAILSLETEIARLWESGNAEEVGNGLKTVAQTQGAVGIIAGAYVILLDLFANDLTRDHCDKIFSRIAGSIRQLPFALQPLKAIRSDARSLPLPNRSVDFVLSSPPYINVFNYHQHYRSSAELLGYDLLLTARSEIGSNRANRGNRFLTVIQYCLDMAATLRELQRVCTGNARVLLVVGHESNVLSVPFRNSEIIESIATDTGAFRSALSQSRWYTNKFGVRIREDLLHLEPMKDQVTSWDSVARSVAARELSSGLAIASEKNLPALREAILRVETIKGIPTLNNDEQAHSTTDSTPCETEGVSPEYRFARG